MAKRKKKARTFRSLITKRIAKAGNKKSKLSELRRARVKAEKELKSLNRRIAREEKRQAKSKRRRATVKLKNARERRAQHKRQLKTLANIRKAITRRKKKRGRKSERKAKIESSPRKLRSGKKYGEKKTYAFNKFNHGSNYIAIDRYITGLKNEAKRESKTIYATIQINGRLRKGAKGAAVGYIQGKTAGKSPAGFVWLNLLKAYMGGAGINVDVSTIDAKIATMVESIDWMRWADSGLPQIKYIVINTTEAINA